MTDAARGVGRMTSKVVPGRPYQAKKDERRQERVRVYRMSKSDSRTVGRDQVQESDKVVPG